MSANLDLDRNHPVARQLAEANNILVAASGALDDALMALGTGGDGVTRCARESCLAFRKRLAEYVTKYR